MNSKPSSSSDRPMPIRPLTALLGVLGLALLVADGLIHKHGHFSVENLFGFYPLCGLLSPILLVLAARGLRPVLQREATYYEDASDGC
jgi:hypothetical protein